MPVLPPIPSIPTVVIHSLATAAGAATNVSTGATAATPASSSGPPLPVICAWPVSGQYGPGSRVLYYVLVATCVLARKTEWLRNACLAAALLFPAVAALHGIVLAALHIDGAVDLDVYGAFQLCSIGILAAPATVRISKTYFYDPGRNIIFLWTGLILAGLLSLTVEFYRTNTIHCSHDGSGNPISLKNFPYGEELPCTAHCVVGDDGPQSPLRRGSANNIYAIPAPDKLTFGTATLLAAACCIPAILSMVSMWNKIVEINVKSRFGIAANDGGKSDEPIEGTNGATIKKMGGVDSKIRFFLSVVEVPVFGGAVLAILIVGERNFFSKQVDYQTEPIASIGQWAPIVGTGLAALGSLYLLFATDAEAMKLEAMSDAASYRGGYHPDFGGDLRPPAPALQIQRDVDYVPTAAGARRSFDLQSVFVDNASQNGKSSSEMQQVGLGIFDSPGAGGARHDSLSGELAPTVTNRSTAVGSLHPRRTRTSDSGSRRKVAMVMTTIGNYLGTAAHELYDDSEFRRGKAVDFPEIPGEEHRNSALPQIRELYNPRRDAHGNATPLPRSRASSFTGSVMSGFVLEGGVPRPRAGSHQPSRSPSPMPSAANGPRRPHASTFPVGRPSYEIPGQASSSSAPAPAAAAAAAVPVRQDTLTVPSPTHHSPYRVSFDPVAISSVGGSTRERASTPAITASPPTMSPSTPVRPTASTLQPGQPSGESPSPSSAQLPRPP